MAGKFARGFRILFVLLAAFVSSPVWAAGPLFRALDNGMRVAILPNGLKVVLIPSEDTSIVALTLVNAGFLDEKRPGVAHRLEHDVFRGTKAHPGSEYDANLDKNSIETNANTDLGQTNFYLVGPKDK